MTTPSDNTFMTQALRLAQQGLYTTTPNPRVGCVIAKDDQVVGVGVHLKAGDPHAEVNALRLAGAHAQGAVAYVTLEPCSHHGKTPPCAEALVNAGIKHVVVAMEDPNPLVAGQGIQYLKDQGLTVDVGLMQADAEALNIGFIKRMKHNMPFVRCKVAASLDGKTALSNGKSYWITGEPARLDVQRWRAQSCAVITGIGTILVDDPKMSVRLDSSQRQPLRVIVDSQLNIPLDSAILNEYDLTDYPVAIAYAKDKYGHADALKAKGAQLLHLPQDSSGNTRVNLTALLSALATDKACNEVLIEAGHGLNGGFLQGGLIDECIFYYAPKLMGGDAMPVFSIKALTSMSETIDLEMVDVRQFGNDIRVVARPALAKS
jgi:diaminohydroxyphosphoribosylaminopyrimidine deaminase/5-amino-6-(5-phosphoribosylamino)uracil reductase